jgi:hypothetical protein
MDEESQLVHRPLGYCVMREKMKVFFNFESFVIPADTLVTPIAGVIRLAD